MRGDKNMFEKEQVLKTTFTFYLRLLATLETDFCVHFYFALRSLPTSSKTKPSLSRRGKVKRLSNQFS